MKVGRIVRERRKALGLTQEQVAEALGISAPAVNKWEREASLPDITLLPPLARLLGIDLNTLLSFQENLTDGEITQFVNSLDETVQRQGYDAAFQAAREKLREFPSCDRLRHAAAMYLNGALLLYPPPDQALYQPQLEQWIQDLAESPDPEIRQAALPMLISRFRQQGELEKARQLIDSLAAPGGQGRTAGQAFVSGAEMGGSRLSVGAQGYEAGHGFADGPALPDGSG